MGLTWFRRRRRERLVRQRGRTAGEPEAEMAELEAELGVRASWSEPEPAPGPLSQLSALNPISLYQNAAQQREAETQEQIERLQREQLALVTVVAFVGPSGTGKSTQAIRVARENNIAYLIDDGLLIHGGRILAGSSAKRAGTRIESVRQALFYDESRAATMRRTLAEQQPVALMVLGTSDGMVERICENLWLKPPAMRIGIEDVTDEEERRIAQMTRLTEGQHTIPVPSMEIKHEFSGYFQTYIDRFRRRIDRDRPGLAADTSMERTVVRPTFSTLGRYSISDEAMRHMIALIAAQVEGVAYVTRVELETGVFGVTVDCRIALHYGYEAQRSMRLLQETLIRELERYTSINIISVAVRAVRVVHPVGERRESVHA
ncbi:MAG: ATP-binding protein [Bacillota bacterium]|nr:ATP-binding protein [Bacillota bacterium]